MAFVLALPERQEKQLYGVQVPREKVLRAAVLDVLTQQLASAIRSVGEAGNPEASDKAATEGVHEARKSLKRIRSTLRLLRRALGQRTFKAESQCFGAIGRALSETREFQVMVEVLRNLGRAVAAEPPTPPPTTRVDLPATEPSATEPSVTEPQVAAPAKRPAPTGYAEAVVAAHKAWRESPHPAVRVKIELRDKLVQDLENARARLTHWRLRDLEQSLRSGLRQAVKRARRDWKVVCQPGPTAESALRFHELRKRVKDLFYMSALLLPAEPEFLGDLSAQLDELADLLGDDHDLTTLAERAAIHPEALGGPAVLTPLLEFASYRQHALREAAQPLLESVLEVKPGRLARVVVQGLRDRIG